MAGEKKYLSATGVDEFHYGILNAGGTGIVAAAPMKKGGRGHPFLSAGQRRAELVYDLAS